MSENWDKFIVGTEFLRDFWMISFWICPVVGVTSSQESVEEGVFVSLGILGEYVCLISIFWFDNSYFSGTCISFLPITTGAIADTITGT